MDTAACGDEIRVVLPVQLTSLNSLLGAFDAFCDRHGIAGQERYQLDTAIDEVATNIISYAWDDPTGQEYEVTFCMPLPDRCRIVFRDRGRPFDPTQADSPDVKVPLHERPIGGLGIHMVREFTDSIEYRRQDDWNVLTIEKQLGGK